MVGELLDSIDRILSVDQPACVVWITGMSGAGKSTCANALADRLRSSGYRVEVLDGDAIREQLSKGLTYSRQDRNENIRRIGFVAELLSRNGVMVIVAAISGCLMAWRMLPSPRTARYSGRCRPA